VEIIYCKRLRVNYLAVGYPVIKNKKVLVISQDYVAKRRTHNA